MERDLIQLGDHEKKALKIIEYLQTHPEYVLGRRNSKNDLEKAVRLGIDIVKKLLRQFGHSKH